MAKLLDATSPNVYGLDQHNGELMASGRRRDLIALNQGASQVNWGDDPDGRARQIRIIFLSLLEPEANLYIQQAEEKQREIEQLESRLQEKIKSYSMTAYNSLETMVHSLLMIEKGERTYTNLHLDTIVGALDDCTDKFSQLSTACGSSVQDLGKKAGDCMELKDSIGSFISDLKMQLDQVNGPVESIMERKRERDRNLDDKRQRHQELEQQLRDIKSSQNDFGYQFSSFFSNDAENNLRNRVNDAQERLAKNEMEQRMELEKSQQFYELAVTSMNGGAAIATLIEQVQRTQKKMDFEYSHVTDHHAAADGLLRGLLDLKNQLYAGDWTSTRDRSLQVVLQLMQKDDEVFQRQAYYEDMEVRVKAAIVSKLGEGAVDRLLSPAAPPIGYVEY